MRFSAYTLAFLFLQFQVLIIISHSAVIFFYTKKLSFRLTLNPGLALTCFRKTRLYMPVEIFGPFSWYVGRFQFDAKFCLEIAENFQWRMEQRISAFRLKGQPCEVYPDSTASSLSFPLKSVGSKTFQNEVSKTNKRASVTVNVTREQECREPLVAQTRSHITLAVTLARLLVCVILLGFSRKRETARVYTDIFETFLLGISVPFDFPSGNSVIFCWKVRFSEINIRDIFNTRIIFEKSISGLSGNFPNPFITAP